MTDSMSDLVQQARKTIKSYEAENKRLREAGQNLIDDVRKRYPNEELRCEYMIALEQALKGEE